MTKTRIAAFLILCAGLGVGAFTYLSENPQSSVYRPFQLGLDLSGGTHLVYEADVSSIPQEDVEDAMATLRDVIERRVNTFGVSQPVVQTERAGALAQSEEGERLYRLIVELPGVTDVKQATDIIGQTPVLEFMVERPQDEQEPATGTTTPEDVLNRWEQTELTGRFLDNAQLQFNQNTNAPIVVLNFNEEGGALFAELTSQNVGNRIAVFLDRHLGNTEPITAPVVREEIPNGQAEITGNFTADEAKQLVQRLNSGALPVDELELLRTQTIGASLGTQATNAGVIAGIWGLALVALFLVIWYRLPGILATIALSIYVAIMLSLFKLIPVTLTAAGIAGFVLSIGMAVDANVLIFERMKEELRKGKTIFESVHDGFSRAWLSIRDGNISSIITAIILFWFGTSLVEGFALTFGLGVIVSMLSAIVITRTFLLAFATDRTGGVTHRLFRTGVEDVGKNNEQTNE